jgi:hypothetical protein
VPLAEATNLFFRIKNGLANQRGAATSNFFLACASVRAGHSQFSLRLGAFA